MPAKIDLRTGITTGTLADMTRIVSAGLATLLLVGCGVTPAPNTPDEVAALGQMTCAELLANTLPNAPSPIVQRARQACAVLQVVAPQE